MKPDVGSRQHDGSTGRKELGQLGGEAIVVEGSRRTGLDEDIDGGQQLEHTPAADPTDLSQRIAQLRKPEGERSVQPLLTNTTFGPSDAAARVRRGSPPPRRSLRGRCRIEECELAVLESNVTPHLVPGAAGPVERLVVARR